MDYQALRNELLNDPLTASAAANWDSGTSPFGAYSGLTDQLAADKLNATNTGRTQMRTSVSRQEIFRSIVQADWPSTALAQNKLMVLMMQDTVNAADTNTRNTIASIFAAGSQTLTNLNALGTQAVSRATELNLGVVLGSDVTKARSGTW